MKTKVVETGKFIWNNKTLLLKDENCYHEPLCMWKRGSFKLEFYQDEYASKKCIFSFFSNIANISILSYISEQGTGYIYSSFIQKQIRAALEISLSSVIIKLWLIVLLYIMILFISYVEAQNNCLCQI